MFYKTHNHGQAVRHGDEIRTSMLGLLLGEVAHDRRVRRDAVTWKVILIILQAELSRVLANDLDIAPAKSFETLSSNLTERGGEVNKVDTGKELGDVDEGGHGLNVPARSSTDLRQSQLVTSDTVVVQTYINPDAPLLFSLL